MIAHKKALKINSGVQTDLIEKEEASSVLKGEIEIVTKLDVALQTDLSKQDRVK